MRTLNYMLLLIAALALSVLLSGCGSGTDSVAVVPVTEGSPLEPGFDSDSPRTLPGDEQGDDPFGSGGIVIVPPLGPDGVTDDESEEGSADEE